MNDRFEICHPITAGWEGGWSDHPADPGGKTMYGITQATYDAWRKANGLALQSVAKITKAEALKIYRRNYWEACGADRLAPGPDLATYDASVNSGVSRGRRWLMASIGGTNAETVKRICKARLSFVQALSNWKTFGKGWGRRIADIEVKGVAMALAAAGATESRIRAEARTEAATAKKSAASARNTATAAGSVSVASGGSPAVSPDVAADPAALWILGALCLALAVVAIVLIVRHRAQSARADAYGELAHAS